MFTQTPTILGNMSIAHLVNLKPQLLRTGLYFRILLQQTCYFGRTAVIFKSMTLALTRGSVRTYEAEIRANCRLSCLRNFVVFFRKLNCGIVSENGGGTHWRSWLRHCATSLKVAGSIPDGVIGIFNWYNASGCTMTLKSTQPLTEMNTRNLLWGKGGRCVVLTTLTPSCADCFEIWETQPPGNLRVCPGL
jgi:hypothetical protein